jgi:hypothetical protein
MKQMLLLSLVVVMVSSCAMDDPYAMSRQQSGNAYPQSYPRQTYPPRKPDALGDINREARSVRSLLGNILGMKRDLSR